MNAPEPSLTHRFTEDDPNQPVLLLLHGTGGRPDDLVPLAQRLNPKSAILAPAGPVSENGMSRWFRRFAEGVFDTEDVIARTHQLADFVQSAREHYGLVDRRLVAVGFSNGANIAASLLLLRPDVLREAVLFAAMLPVPEPPVTDLSRTRVFLSSGDHDPMAPLDSADRLVQTLVDRSATVRRFRHHGGHEITLAGLNVAAGWLTERPK